MTRYLPALRDEVPDWLRISNAQSDLQAILHSVEEIKDVDRYAKVKLRETALENPYLPVHIRLGEIERAIQSPLTEPTTDVDTIRGTLLVDNKDAKALLATLHPDAQSDVEEDTILERERLFKQVASARDDIKTSGGELSLAVAEAYAVLARDQITFSDAEDTSQTVDEVEKNRYRAFVGLMQATETFPFTDRDAVNQTASEIQRKQKLLAIPAVVSHLQRATLGALDINPDNPEDPGRISGANIEAFKGSFNSLSRSLEKFRELFDIPRKRRLAAERITSIQDEVGPRVEEWASDLEALVQEMQGSTSKKFLLSNGKTISSRSLSPYLMRMYDLSSTFRDFVYTVERASREYSSEQELGKFVLLSFMEKNSVNEQ